MQLNTIEACITCCQINSNNGKNGSSICSLLVICPYYKAPCSAINRSVFIDSESKNNFLYYVELMNQDKAKGTDMRIPIISDFIDRDFVEVRKGLFEELSKAGNKDIYVMEAY